MMLVRSNALSKVIVELGSKDKIDREARSGKSVLSILHQEAMAVGCLRLLSLRDELHLKFKGIYYTHMAGGRDPVGDVLKEVIDHSRLHKLKPAELRPALEELIAAGHDPWLICCGHDVSAALGKLLQKRIGSNNSKEVRAEDIESKLRLAFSEDDFRATKLYAEMKGWEAAQAPYQCLRI